MKTIVSMILLSFASVLSSQEMVPCDWSFDINQVGQDDYELIFRADINAPWQIYSKDTEEGGPIPTTVTYTSKNLASIGNSKESGERKEGVDELFEMNVIKYLSNKPYVLKQTVKVSDISQPIKGYITYMACDNEKCLPPRDVDFSFTINVVNPIKKVNKDLKIKNF
jgi:thiol:disulfide interchange protein DsbD